MLGSASLSTVSGTVDAAVTVIGAVDAATVTLSTVTITGTDDAAVAARS